MLIKYDLGLRNFINEALPMGRLDQTVAGYFYSASIKTYFVDIKVFCEQIFIFSKRYMLQCINAVYYPLPPKTDGKVLQYGN